MRRSCPALERSNRGHARPSGGAGTTQGAVLYGPHALAMQPGAIQRGITGSGGGVTHPIPPVAETPKAMRASGGRNSMNDAR